mmetsp:Transcript_2619/g.5316  ORF Transcript_2619/g.5316 Transcript_2619/m.5316 type:complete len:120 (-) Transcript_2619:107-466(-)
MAQDEGDEGTPPDDVVHEDDGDNDRPDPDPGTAAPQTARKRKKREARREGVTGNPDKVAKRSKNHSVPTKARHPSESAATLASLRLKAKSSQDRLLKAKREHVAANEALRTWLEAFSQK